MILNSQQAVTPKPTIPNWPWPKGFDPAQQALLIQLSDAGKLSGIPPQILAYMQQAESGFGYSAGGAINSAGYGGYFGLGNNKSYPAGTSTTAILQSTDPLAYAAQAIIAASEFASLMVVSGGDYVGAENAYQTGSTTSSANGAGIFKQYGITSSTSGVQNLPNNPVTGIGSAVVGVANAVTKPFTDINSFFASLGSGFGLGWTGIFTIILGIGFIFVAMLFLFHRQTAQAAHAAIEAA